MTRICTRAAALAVALAVGALPASAQRSRSQSSGSILHSLTWSAGAGVSMPTGDLGDGKGDGEIDRQQDGERNATPKRVDESEENGGVNEIEAVRDLA